MLIVDPLSVHPYAVQVDTQVRMCMHFGSKIAYKPSLDWQRVMQK